MHIGIVYMGRRGIAGITLEQARSLSAIAQVTCYLSSGNELLDDFGTLPCSVKTFRTYSGYRSLLCSLATRLGPKGVAREVEADAPDVVLDTGSGPWKGIIQHELGGKIPQAEVVHDVHLHPDRWNIPTRTLHALFPSQADIYVSLSHYSHGSLLRKFPNAWHIKSRHGVLHCVGTPEPGTIAARRNRMLFFGRIEAYKGIDVLVDAFDKAKPRDRSLELSIVGRGPISARTRRRARDLGIVVRNEWIATSEVPSIILSHGAMVLPYLSATQSGIAGIALGNGMPCIGTNTGALPEQILHGRNGLIVPPGDSNALAEAMLTIAESELLATEMSAQAREVAREQFEWDRIGIELLKDLEDAVSAVGVHQC